MSLPFEYNLTESTDRQTKTKANGDINDNDDHMKHEQTEIANLFCIPYFENEIDG